MLTSPFLLAALPAQRARGARRRALRGRVHGLVASPYKAAYVAAKHGVLGLVKTLALEGAEHGMRDRGLPGFVRTPLVEGQLDDQARTHGVPRGDVLERVVLAPHGSRS